MLRIVRFLFIRCVVSLVILMLLTHMSKLVVSGA